MSFKRRVLNSVPCDASCIMMARLSWRPPRTTSAASHVHGCGQRTSAAKVRAMTVHVKKNAYQPMKLERSVSSAISSLLKMSLSLRLGGDDVGAAVGGVMRVSWFL